MNKNKPLIPIVKWVGGKRQLLLHIQKHIPKFSTYYEPFLGGGAVLFSLRPKQAIVSDINVELMNMYNVVKYNIDELIESLKQHENTEEYFYAIRELDRNRERYMELSLVERASRIIFLNRTCYNGLFRVNRSGEFNSPFGNYKNPNIINEITLRTVSKYFNDNKIQLRCEDFEKATKNADKNSFIYLDPPYDPISLSSCFTGYDKGGFDREQQVRLKKVCDSLNKKGAKFLLSNSATDFIKSLFKDYLIETVSAKRLINSKSDKRGDVSELLVRNFE